MPGSYTQPAYFKDPNIRIQTTPSPYKSRFSSDSPIGQIINKLGSTLRPQQAFSDVLSYDTYAAPQRAVYDQFVKGVYRPQFEYSTLNPWNAQYSNNAAANNSNLMGNAKDIYKRNLSGIERNYQDNLLGMTNSYEDMLREGFNRKIQDYYNSPTSFNNIGM